VDGVGALPAGAAFYTRPLDINDQVPLYCNSRGLSYAEQKLYEAAVADYNRALALDDGYIGVAAYLTICPEDGRQTVRNILAALAVG
jgi:tetratricopeptide (TPR) repeat protein